MNALFSAGFACCCLVLSGPAVAAGASLDIRRAVPPDAYLYIHGQYNPEREYQREYLEDICNTVRETNIFPRALKIVTSRMAKDDLAAATAILDEIKEALAPIDVDAVMRAKELVYAQRMEGHTSQHLLLMRLPRSVAAGCNRAIRNLFALAEKYSEGAVRVETAKKGTIPYACLQLPEGVPMSPTVAHFDDVFLLSSSKGFAELSRALILGEGGESKFDDPRLQEALAQLPEAEDSIIFYDGKEQFRQLRKTLQFARQESADNPTAERWLGLANMILDEVDILDYELAVEYTEENRNCYASLGKLQPGCEEKLLVKMFCSGEAFENWERWVPADAESYSLSTGVNLHALYDYVEQLIEEQVPEAQESWQQFQAWQDDIDFHVDADLLQAFSGECVSVTLPAGDELAGPQSVVAMRCHKPERVEELLLRMVGSMEDVPLLAAQQVQVRPSQKLEAFHQFSAPMLEMFSMRPVVGFRDGWMIIGCNVEVVERVLATRAGDAPAIVASEEFQKFNMPVEGPVYAVSYTDMAASIRKAAKFLNGAGAVLPVVIGMIGIEADSEELRPVQEAVALLPDVGKIIEKFDFMEAQLWVVQGGPSEDTWMERYSIEIRPPTLPGDSEGEVSEEKAQLR